MSAKGIIALRDMPRATRVSIDLKIVIGSRILPARRKIDSVTQKGKYCSWRMLTFTKRDVSILPLPLLPRVSTSSLLLHLHGSTDTMAHKEAMPWTVASTLKAGCIAH